MNAIEKCPLYVYQCISKVCSIQVSKNKNGKIRAGFK